MAPFSLPRQFGEVGEVAEWGDDFGLGDEGADFQVIQEAEVSGVRRWLREGQYLVLMGQGQPSLGLEALHFEVVVLEELGDALAGLRPEVVVFVALGFDQQRPTLFRVDGQEVEVVVLKARVASAF